MQVYPLLDSKKSIVNFNNSNYPRTHYLFEKMSVECWMSHCMHIEPSKYSFDFQTMPVRHIMTTFTVSTYSNWNIMDALQLLTFNQQCTNLYDEIILQYQNKYDSSECIHRCNQPILLSNGTNTCSEYVTNIINLIETCFERNGFMNQSILLLSQWKLWH